MRTWITLLPSKLNGTDNGDQKFRDALFLCYSIETPYPAPNFDGCNTPLYIYHALDFSQGGLIPACHNELRDGVSYHSGKSFIPSHVRDDPLIHPGCAVWEGKAHIKGSLLNDLHVVNDMSEKEGELIICNLRHRRTDSSQDMHAVKNDAL